MTRVKWSQDEEKYLTAREMATTELSLPQQRSRRRKRLKQTDSCCREKRREIVGPKWEQKQQAALTSILLFGVILTLVSGCQADKQELPSNVIVIKYANVSQEPVEERPLNVFQLHNEPLSVNIIESRFASSIELFDVSRNQLSTLSKDLFCPLSNEVRQLNISHNLLENFDCLGLISQAGQLCLSELRILDMSHNLIKHLPATGVATLHNLEVLNLSHNLIESLDELSLSSLFKLNRLDLSYNRIQQLPLRIFHKSTSMQVLRLQSNQLQTNINHMFLAGLISLEELDLSHNNLTAVADSAFLDKVNLTHVDLTHNQLTSLRQDALRVTSVKQALGYRHRLHHNGQYAGVAPRQAHSQSASAEFYLASNPFVCDCQLEWLRKFQPSTGKRTVLTSSGSPYQRTRVEDTEQVMLADQAAHDLMHLASAASHLYQNDQPTVILAPSSADSSNNISEIISNQQQVVDPNSNNANQQQQQRPQATLLTNSQASSNQQHVTHHYARVGDLDLIKCSPLFRRNNQRQHDSTRHRPSSFGGHSRMQAPSDGAHQSHSVQHHNYHANLDRQQYQDTMINLMSADSSNFLCRYKSHCFALCHCCEFDACDCEMICPSGCNCYYDSTWQTNIIDCSSNNHTVVPDRIPMDVSGLYLDGNNIGSLKPSNLIARKSLKTLYLNASNLQYIANRTFNGLIELQTLYLHDNMLASLHGYEFEPLAQLRALYLQSNRLDHISNQTFIYLRSLEILDLSNNRLTSTNLDLFWSIGHHNIRLRHLSIAHNWWSCQCSSINRFRQILKQKFLLNGSVNIGDKNQLRCYYNSTTVGPLILSENSASLQPLFVAHPSSAGNNQRQQTQLTEINQCSELIGEPQEIVNNPPLIEPFSELPSTLPPNQPGNGNHEQYLPDHIGSIPIYPGLNQPSQESDTINQPGGTSGQRLVEGGSMQLTSLILLSILLAGLMVIVLSIFVFVRQQQRYHQSHNKKSSAASTTSASSSASSTAISSLNGKAHRHHHLHQQHTLHNPHLNHLNHHHHHHLIMSNGTNVAASVNHLNSHNGHHHHSASSQSNIYAALVSPTTANSTTVTNSTGLNGNSNFSNRLPQNQQTISNNLYSNSSSNASHHSGSSSHGQTAISGGNGYPQHWHSASQHNQSLYNQPTYATAMGAALENPYAINASYKTPGSLYNAPMANNCHESSLQNGPLDTSLANDWIKLPKVKQFMSKLVNKSLALGGYRSNSRDELAAITSDKIYDAFISYDKRDETFVMQHLSAQLEYGEPQYRIADRYRDLPLPSSAYIAEAITSVIGCSHRTIIVLTESYLANEWCRFELQAALQEANSDRAHKILVVVVEPKCLLALDSETRALLAGASNLSQLQPADQTSQLVQLDNCEQQLVATLTSQTGGNQQVSTQTLGVNSRISLLSYQERKFWPKLKQLMPAPRAPSQTLTLTTKN